MKRRILYIIEGLTLAVACWLSVTQLIFKQSISRTALRQKATIWYKSGAQLPIAHQSALEELGKMLFYDARLSQDGRTSCVSCHGLDSYGVDGKPLSVGNTGHVTARNSPTVLNVSLCQIYGWDGASATLESHIRRPLESASAMGISDTSAVVQRFANIPEYVQLFSSAFEKSPTALNYTNMCVALAAFERTLITTSRFDAFMSGDTTALSDAEIEGLQLFIRSDCIECHEGPGVGGNQQMRFGYARQYWSATGSAKIDSGIYSSSHDPDDLFRFRVPSLRNVEKTAPYFHDGSVRRLEDAIRVMKAVQFGEHFSDAEVDKVAAFLRSLTGIIPEDVRKQPQLPGLLCTGVQP